MVCLLRASDAGCLLCQAQAAADRRREDADRRRVEKEERARALAAPVFAVDRLFPGTFYLEEVTATYERVYRRKPLTAPRATGGPLKVCLV